MEEPIKLMPVAEAKEPIKLMPVAEAIALTNKNAINIETIARAIKNQSSNGARSIRYFDMLLPFDVMKEVMAAGYTISQDRGPGGENVIVISW